MLEEDTIIGDKTVIGEDSILQNVALGADCVVGNNVSLRDCIIHDSVVIGSNCQLKGCIIGHGVKVGCEVVIHDKSVLAPGVCIKDRCKPIGPTTWIVASPGDTEGEEGSEFGPKAFLYIQDNDGYDGSDSDSEKARDLTIDNGLEETWGCLALSDNEGDDGDSDSSLADDDSDEQPDEQLGDIMLFRREVLETLEKGAEEGTESENLLLEINGSRYAYAISPTEIIHGVIISILTITMKAAVEDGSDATNLLNKTKAQLQYFKKLISTFVKSESQQEDCITAIAMFCQSELGTFLPVIAKVVHFLYDIDLLSEDSILEWYDNDENEELADGIHNKIKQKLRPLIEWFENQSDSEESSDN